jgi:hypothetical protein
MEHKEFLETLKGCDFTELIQLYIEAKTGKYIDIQSEFNSYDLEQIENIDASIFCYIAIQNNK